jgi:hypothetical protein
MMLSFSLSEVAGLLVAAVCLTSWFVSRSSKKENPSMNTLNLPQIVSDISKLIADAKPLIAEVTAIVTDVKAIITDLNTLFPPPAPTPPPPPTA